MPDLLPTSDGNGRRLCVYSLTPQITYCREGGGNEKGPSQTLDDERHLSFSESNVIRGEKEAQWRGREKCLREARRRQKEEKLCIMCREEAASWEERRREKSQCIIMPREEDDYGYASEGSDSERREVQSEERGHMQSVW